MRSSTKRRGAAAVLAMVYLVLLSSLALGFYAATTNSIQIVTNERNITEAELASESGLEYMRYRISQVVIPPETAGSEIFNEVYAQLKGNLEATPSFQGKTVSSSGSSISVPSDPTQYITLDAFGSRFRATIQEVGPNMRVRTTGRHRDEGILRAVTLDYQRFARPTTVFNYAISSQGAVVMKKGTIAGVAGVSSDKIATVMSAMEAVPAISVSGGTIGGDLNVTGPGLASVTGGSVGGTTDIAQIQNNHTHVIEAPEFPLVDTTVFAKYAVNTYSGGLLLKNTRIPANTNPKFLAGAILQGILYIESPNIVEFRGTVLLQGFIVFENKGTVSENIIDMRGNFAHFPLPAGAEFDPLRSIKGIAIAAPTTQMVVSGSVDSFLDGNVMLGTFHSSGSADLVIDKGTLMTYSTGPDAAVFDGKNVRFKSIGAANIPTVGLKFHESYRPDPTSYQEVSP